MVEELMLLDEGGEKIYERKLSPGFMDVNSGVRQYLLGYRHWFQQESSTEASEDIYCVL